MARLKHSMTLYSFYAEFAKQEMSLEDCFRKSAEFRADGVELVASEMMASYPWNDENWNSYFKDLLVKYNMTPVCYSAYIDMGTRTDRDMNDLEKFESTIKDLDIAYRLGFKILRSQHSLSPKVMEQCLPYAEAYGIQLAVELHGPHQPSTPVWQEYLNLYQRKNSEFLGVVPDLGCVQAWPPLTYTKCFDPEVEGNKELCDEMVTMFRNMASYEECDEFRVKNGGGEKEKRFLDNMFHDYHRDKAEYEGLKEFLPFAKYIHGQFNYVDENFHEPSISYETCIPLIKESGFNGFICSEFGGHGWDPELNSEEQIRRHIHMLDLLWGE